MELLALITDRGWLDDITKTLSQHWRRKNEHRKDRIDVAGNRIARGGVKLDESRRFQIPDELAPPNPAEMNGFGRS